MDRDTFLSNYNHPDNCQCYECRMAQADADVCQAMSRRERLEKQIEKEKENVSTDKG